MFVKYFNFSCILQHFTLHRAWRNSGQYFIFIIDYSLQFAYTHTYPNTLMPLSDNAAMALAIAAVTVTVAAQRASKHQAHRGKTKL